MRIELTRFFTLVRSRVGLSGFVLIAGLLIAEGIVTAMLLNGESPIDMGILERVAAKERLSIHESIVYGTWVAKLVVVILGAILLGLSWWWARTAPTADLAEVAAATAPQTTRFTWRFWVPLLLAVLLAGVWRIPRLDHSLWNDEELAVRKYVVGGHSVDPNTNEIKFNPIPWERTFYYSLNGQNHTVQSVASRLGHDIWRWWNHAEPGEFSESAIRFGPLIASLFTVALIGIWLGKEGFPRAGITTAFILALNPWHIRYSVEARGYSFLLLFLVLMFLCLGPALKTRKWRYWIGFGASQALALLSFAAALFVVVPVNLVIAGVLLKNRDLTGIWRWIFVCLCGAAFVSLFLLPTVLGFMGWLNSLDESPSAYDWHYFREFWGHLMLGVSWREGNPTLETGVGLLDVVDAHIFKKVIVYFLIPVITVVGTFLAIRRSYSLRLFCSSIALAIVTICIYCQFSDTPFHGWYAVYLVLWFTLALGFLGGDFHLPGAKLSRQRVLNWLPSALLVVGYGWVTSAPRSTISVYDRHPMRAAVALVHEKAPALGGFSGTQAVAFGAGAKQFRSYDPRILAPRNLAELDAIQADAVKNGHKLIVFVTGPTIFHRQQPDVGQALNDSARFNDLGIVKAVEYFWSIQVYEAL